MPALGSIQGAFGAGRVSGQIPNSALFICDNITQDVTNLIASLNRRGIYVKTTERSSYTGQNPPPTPYSAAVLIDGASYDTDLSGQAQARLVEYVRNGGKFIGSEWSAYQVKNGRFQLMKDLVLLVRTSSTTGSITYTIDPAIPVHPVLVGFTGSITVGHTGYTIGTARQFVTVPPSVPPTQSTVLANHAGTSNAGIIVRTLGLGKIVAFSHAGSYSVGVLSNPDVQRLYFNSIMW
jgi:hypothetical protein